MCVYDGANVVSYIDGSRRTTTPGVSGELGFRGYRHLLGRGFKGSLRELVIENRAYTDAEIGALYDRTRDMTYSPTVNGDRQQLHGVTVNGGGNYELDGVDDYIEITGYSFDDIHQMSFEVLFRADGLEDGTLILDKGFSLRAVVNANGSGHCIFATKNNPWYGTGTAASWPAGTIAPSTWHHLICVYDGQKPWPTWTAPGPETPARFPGHWVTTRATPCTWERRRRETRPTSMAR
jgi:hypothetical protein